MGGRKPVDWLGNPDLPSIQIQVLAQFNHCISSTVQEPEPNSDPQIHMMGLYHIRWLYPT